MFPKENGNGYHHHHHEVPPPGMGNGDSVRRVTRRPRASSSTSTSSDTLPVVRVPEQQQLQQQRLPCTEFDMAYFNSYSHLGIHQEMIKDRVRTETYREAVMRHQSFIAGKVVLDVGCGTGILSIFCAQAGAKRVYAVDASDIALKAHDIVEANNLSDVVVVLHGRVEDVEIDEEVDVIISEWMGYMLLYESMLGSVITARDRWLKPGGLILPSNASLYMAPVTHADRYSEYIDFWRNVYGINMSPMISLAKQSASEEPSVETITGENILTWPHEVKYIDSYSITIHELETITSSFKFNSMMRAPLHGFAFWFDVEFNGPAIQPINSHSTSSTNNHLANGNQRRKRTNPNDALVLSTAPENPPTHWQQTLIYFYEPIALEQDQPIEGSITLSQNKENARFININLEYSVGGRSYVKQSVMK
ncbi:PREDICTED: probable protein arginine N-methyltransferase 6 [Lupinus angustifolius]|uniref:probable protein arginine N-methyltransferase 6 n=1 Tax=Lupinus angustifolius TaxID=3871 RepID=UPI00092F6EE1|nr:PREDICTED: probable protein arginine N-methyltransferase 6 [Lupinus angustifolius]